VLRRTDTRLLVVLSQIAFDDDTFGGAEAAREDTWSPLAGHLSMVQQFEEEKLRAFSASPDLAPAQLGDVAGTVAHKHACCESLVIPSC